MDDSRFWMQELKGVQDSNMMSSFNLDSSSQMLADVDK